LTALRKLALAEPGSPSPHVTASLGGRHAIFKNVIYTGHNPLLEMAESSLGAVRK
jgi:hypothetical protein